MEYVGHDLNANGNYTVRPKFSLIQDWPLIPPHKISLLSYIVLCCFYNKYCTWLQTNVKLLRKLQRAYHRKDMPIMGWTPSLIKLFVIVKLIFSPPCYYYVLIVHGKNFLKQIGLPEGRVTSSCSLMIPQTLS